MAMDAIPIVFKHLQAIGRRKRLDLFLHSNGGDGIVPWRLVTLIREFCDEFCVLVPHRAFSAATLTALGADRVLMHPMGMLGPTDPSVTNPFNPPNPQAPGQLLPISVEDVASYIALVKEDVGIRHEEELVQAFALLGRKVHPLALGNVKRASAQSRMMGEKLLRQRQRGELDAHEISELIEKLTSQLYFHGHPINRSEAREELRLDFVENPPEAVEETMWALYLAYADELQLDRPFTPLQDAYALRPATPPPPPGFVPPGQAGSAAVSVETVKLGPLTTAVIESAERADLHRTTFEVVLRREWSGALGAEVFPAVVGWESPDHQPQSGSPG